MYANNLGHQAFIRELNIVENAPAQKGIRQLFFRIRCDNDDRALVCPHSTACFRNIKFHLIQLPQQIIGKLQVCLVDLINEQYHLLVTGKRLSQLAEFHILFNLLNVSHAHLAVIEALHNIVDI